MTEKMITTTDSSLNSELNAVIIKNSSNVIPDDLSNFMI